uniref:Putative secreted protein n=1 Tax=Ixodes ricinus TaxID=34613 RepID=A0A6B0U9K5_IXORI
MSPLSVRYFGLNVCFVIVIRRAAAASRGDRPRERRAGKKTHGFFFLFFRVWYKKYFALKVEFFSYFFFGF